MRHYLNVKFLLNEQCFTIADTQAPEVSFKAFNFRSKFLKPLQYLQLPLHLSRYRTNASPGSQAPSEDAAAKHTSTDTLTR